MSEAGGSQSRFGRAKNTFFVLTPGSVSVFFIRRPLWQRVHRYAMGTAWAAFAVRIAADRSCVVLAAP